MKYWSLVLSIVGSIIILVVNAAEDTVSPLSANAGGVDGAEIDCSGMVDAFVSALEEDGADKNALLSQHIGIAMRAGIWDCAKEIVLRAQKQDIVGNDLKNSFELEQRTIVKEIAALRTVIESSLPMSTVAPAFQWAQSTTDIMLNVKFSHKIDAPATLNVEASNVTILANQLVLHASDGRKNFKLDIELLKGIIPEESRYDMASVGRMTFTLRKADSPSKWSRLLKSKDKKANQMHVWWEMADKHRAELEKLDEEESSESSSKKKSKKSGGDKTVAEVSANGEVTNTEEDSDGDDTAVTEDSKKKVPDELAEALKKIDEETKKEIKEINNEGKKKKQAIDAKLKEEKQQLEAKSKLDKREVDTEILSKTDAAEYRARKRKEEAESNHLTASAASASAKVELS
jgi:hypothetical protein